MNSQNGAQISTSIKKGLYKRPFDLMILIFAHALLLPLWLVIWALVPIAIWLEDRGPVFYKQRRAGKDGRAFIIHKFRTMIPDADLKGPAWTVQGDPRLTRVGKILRRTALDELPELWSVFKGDMSFVGPRPLDEIEQNRLEKQIPGFHQRLLIRPGLTGLAQVYDPADVAANKFKFDIEYMENLSPWLDGKLIFLSILNSLGAQWDHRAGKPQDSGNPTTGIDAEQVQEDVVGSNKPSGLI